MDDSVLERAATQTELPPVSRQLRGLLKPDKPLPKDWDYRQELGDQ